MSDDDIKKHLFWDDIEGSVRSRVFLLEKAGQQALATVPEKHADHRESIQRAVDHLRPSYDELAWLLELLRESHPNALRVGPESSSTQTKLSERETN